MAGEKTATTALKPPYEASSGMFLVPFKATLTTGQLELNDVIELGWVPANCTIYGVIFSPSDMDTGTALVQKITVGSTDIASGLTNGQTGTKSFVGVVPLTVTEKSKVTITNTTAAGTPAQGTVYMQLVCQK